MILREPSSADIARSLFSAGIDGKTDERQEARVSLLAAVMDDPINVDTSPYKLLADIDAKIEPRQLNCFEKIIQGSVAVVFPDVSK